MVHPVEVAEDLLSLDFATLSLGVVLEVNSLNISCSSSVPTSAKPVTCKQTLKSVNTSVRTHASSPASSHSFLPRLENLLLIEPD